MRYNGNMEVCTLTLNPCLDRTLWVEAFGLPAKREEWQTGGKGVNVARVLAALGVEARAVCPLGGETGARFIELAKEEGVDVLPVNVPAPTRVIDTWARERDFAQKVDYRAGEPLTEKDLDHLEDKLFSALPGARVLAVCGSAPGEAAAGRVAGILRRAKAMGVATVLDSNGAALLQGVEGLPDLLKPNERELEALTGSADPASAWALIERGVGRVLVSLGERGCCLVGADALGPAELLPLTLGARAEIYAPAPKGKAVNPVGSGDSFLAAYLYAALRGWPDEQALSLANAAGAANARMFPAARVGWKEIGPLLRGRDEEN